MKPVDELFAGCIDVKPRDYRYTARTHADYGDGDTDTEWESWEAVECEKCREVFVVTSGGDERHNEMDPDSECEGYVHRAEGPMMNYFYTLNTGSDDFDEEEAVRSIAHLPLCVVKVDGEWGLALTGGGMDLTWEICEAYMRLGQLPPLHFCDLPDYIDRGQSEVDRWIIDGCRETCNVMVMWAQRARESIERRYGSDE